MRTSPLRAAARGARRRGLPLLTLVPAALALAAAPALAESADTRTFDFVAPGCGGVGGVAANQFTVPTGVTSMSVVIRGEQGGTFGGMGAELSGDITVTPGETLYACVAEGGGAGGAGDFASGQRGGGYALLSRNEDLNSPFGIAGGGGGYGSGPGGNGGDASMIWETRAPMGLSQGLAGAGLGADGNGAGLGGMNAENQSANGRDGTIRRGGAGGIGTNGGGGGGGGVWGGGGGAGSYETGNGAGGGGGTSYCDIADCISRLSGAGGIVSLSWAVPVLDAPTTTSASISTPRPNVGRSITYTATVSPAPSGGTVEFLIGSDTIWGCEAQPVDTTSGVATCTVNAPYQPGATSLVANYSGTDGFAPSDDSLPFTVYSGAVTINPSPTHAFGDVELGRSTTQQFTVTNSGDGALTIDTLDGIYIADHIPYSMPPRSTEFTAADDLCSGRTLAPSASCTVTVVFTPSALGARRGELVVLSDAWNGGDPVALSGIGVEPQPQERQPQERQPETPTTPEVPTTPTTPSTPGSQPSAPAAPSAPATPSKPAETARTPPQPPVGASSPIAPGTPAQVSQLGDVRLALTCPPGQACSVSGTLTLAISGGQARAAAKTTRVLVRFSGVKLAAGKTKTLSLKLPAAFVKQQQRKGVRKLRTTLTVNTVLGNGQRITRRQAVTLLIPRARVAQRAAPRPVERPSFTG